MNAYVSLDFARGLVSLRALIRTVSALAVAVTLFAALPRPATAQSHLDTPLRIWFMRLDCLDETDDWGDSDEVYTVVFAANIRGSLAKAIVRRSNTIGDLDTGEIKYPSAWVQIWALDGTGDPIENPDNVIFLAVPIESDDGDTRAEQVRSRVQYTLIPKLAAYKAAGMSRATMVYMLRIDMENAIEASRGGDDRLGGVQELRYTASDLTIARSGVTVNKSLIFYGSDSRYRLWFKMQ